MAQRLLPSHGGSNAARKGISGRAVRQVGMPGGFSRPTENPVVKMRATVHEGILRVGGSP